MSKFPVWLNARMLGSGQTVISTALTNSGVDFANSRFRTP